MENNTPRTAAEAPIRRVNSGLPSRWTFFGFVAKLWAKLTSPFRSGQFWLELAAIMGKEFFHALMVGIGGSLLWGGNTARNPEIDKFRNGPYPGQSQASNAFGSGYSPQTVMRPSGFVPVTQDNAPPTFPGFR